MNYKILLSFRRDQCSGVVDQCSGVVDFRGPSGNVAYWHASFFRMVNVLIQLLFEIYQEMSNLHRPY